MLYRMNSALAEWIVATKAPSIQIPQAAVLRRSITIDRNSKCALQKILKLL